MVGLSHDLQAEHDSGSMVAYGRGTVPGATMVVNADATSRATTLGPAGTFVTAGVQEGPHGGSDYQAAVQAASQGADGWVPRSPAWCALFPNVNTGLLKNGSLVHI